MKTVPTLHLLLFCLQLSVKVSAVYYLNSVVNTATSISSSSEAIYNNCPLLSLYSSPTCVTLIFKHAKYFLTSSSCHHFIDRYLIPKLISYIMVRLAFQLSVFNILGYLNRSFQFTFLMLLPYLLHGHYQAK